MRSNPAGSIPRALSPVGYALFAVALGAAAGAVLRRTRPALAVTLGVFLAEFGRRHRMTAITFICNLARPLTPAGSYWQVAQGNLGPHGL